MTDFMFLATKNGVRTFERRSDAWHEMAHTLTARQVTSLSVQENTLLAGTTVGVFRSDDLGRTWRPMSKGVTTAHVRAVRHHPQEPDIVLLGTEPATIFRSDDHARTWHECPEVARLRDENDWYLPYSPEAGCVRGFAFHGDRAYAAVEQGGLLRSDDGGQTWHLARGSSGNPHGPLPEGFIHNDVHSVVVHPLSPDLVTAPTGGGLYRSVDGGTAWTRLYECYCRAVWVDPDNADHMILGPADGVDEAGRVEVTVDGGVSWHLPSEVYSPPWPDYMVEQFVLLGQQLLALLSNGHLIVSSITELDWRRIVPKVEDGLAVAVAQIEA